jgi:hypothetical protein
MTSNPTPVPPVIPLKRDRLSVDLPPSLQLLLDHYCEVTGQGRTAVILNLLTVHLPALHDQANDLKKKANALIPSGKKN